MLSNVDTVALLSRVSQGEAQALHTFMLASIAGIALSLCVDSAQAFIVMALQDEQALAMPQLKQVLPYAIVYQVEGLALRELTNEQIAQLLRTTAN